MKRISTLPDSWNTDDENPMRASHELHRLIGPNASFMLYGRRWWVVRFLEGDKDKFGLNSIGELRELYPWQRKLEVLAVGRHFGECVWHLRQGTVRAMVGKGYRPVLEPRSRDWIGFTDHLGNPVKGLEPASDELDPKKPAA